MTKSRTLRKAAAVALSLAMAFSVATVSTDASAAAKPALKKTKVTVKVKKSVKVGIKNAKLVKKLTVKSKNSKVAKAAAVGKKAVKITGVKAGKTKVTVTIKYGKKTLKKNITVKVAKASTDDDGTVVTESLKLIDKDGLQSDGTAAIDDEIQVQIPSTIGTIDRINWYLDDALVGATGMEGSSSSTIVKKAGTLVARVITTKGTTYASDSIKVSPSFARATISNVAVEDDYEDKDISFAKRDQQGIVEFTLSKDYSGKVQIYAEKDGKANGDKLAEFTAKRAVKDGQGVITANDFDSTPYTKHALYVKSFNGATIAEGAAAPANTVSFKTKNDDGSVTYRFFLNGEEDATAVGAKKFIERGSSYIVVFDQDDVIDDDVKATSPNYSNAFTVPYVTAPAKLVVNPISTAELVSTKFVDAEGKTTEWMFGGANTTLADVGLASLDIWNYTDNTVNTTKGTKIAPPAAPAKQTVVKGVYKSGAKGDETKKWYIAEAKTVAGIFAKDAAPLTSEIASLPPAVATDVTIAPKADDAKTTDNEAKIAEVKFTNLLADADVYLVKGDATEAASVKVTKFDASNAKTYAKKVEATKGAASVDIPEAFTEVAVNANGTEKVSDNTYAVVVIPKDQTTYSRIDKVNDTTQKLEQKITKFELAGKTTVAATKGAIDVKLIAKDQYGKSMNYTFTAWNNEPGVTSIAHDGKDNVPQPTDKNDTVTLTFTDYTATGGTYDGGVITVATTVAATAVKGSTWTTKALPTGAKIKISCETAGVENVAEYKVSLV